MLCYYLFKAGTVAVAVANETDMDLDELKAVQYITYI
jgi:hypothetical protein